tara:strand:+ start:218 stop:400 length:183 start_codon:yes stop_codon:yes gene_type:complete
MEEFKLKLSADQWDFLLKDILENNQYNDEETQELWTDIYLRLKELRNEDEYISTLLAEAN